MGTRPTKPGPWPYAQKRRAKLVAERAGHAIKHLDQARNSLDTRAHPAIVALDIADAQRCAPHSAANEEYMTTAQKETTYRAEMRALENELRHTTDAKARREIQAQAKALTRAHIACTQVQP